MIKWVESRVDSMKDTPYMVAYTSSTAKRDELVKLCKKAFGHAPLIVFQLGGVVSANTGPTASPSSTRQAPQSRAYAPELPYGVVGADACIRPRGIEDTAPYNTIAP